MYYVLMNLSSAQYLWLTFFVHVNASTELRNEPSASSGDRIFFFLINVSIHNDTGTIPDSSALLCDDILLLEEQFVLRMTMFVLCVVM